MELTPVQVRVLGCLVEKERTTPDNYPLTMNGLITACNQTTNRWPIVTLTEATVGNAIENLKGVGLLRVVYSRSNRADKFRHVLGEAWGLDAAELALLGVLMVRGPQTAVELRTRTERLHSFAGLDEMGAVLERLAARPEPLVVDLGRAPGQKEPRWGHLLGGDVPPDSGLPVAEAPRSSRSERIDKLEVTVTTLQEDLRRLRADHDALADRLRGLLD
ncbi:MAG TPA: YceH family protein [Acidimicrobiales bacterium]|nr:YceH family protein [Acidimicrobiales bacterium]